MLILDVDGVVTDPYEKRVTEPQILEDISQRLHRNEPVAFNTGRSIEWVKDRVIKPLLEIINDLKIMSNLIVVGEKGGTWATFDENGRIQFHKDNSISVPKSLKETIRKLMQAKFSSTMFYDESKQTMISTEMKDGCSPNEFSNQQTILEKDMAETLEAQKLSGQFVIDPTTIATDIQNKHVGKDLGVDRILKWLEEKGIKPKAFIAIGDSESDIKMAERLNQLDLPVKFVFVGHKKLSDDYPFPIITTQQPFGKGVVKYLNSSKD